MQRSPVSKFCKDLRLFSFSLRLRECHLNSTQDWKKWWNSVKWKQSLAKRKILRPGEVAFPSQLMKGSVCWFSGRRTCCSKLESMFLPKTPAWLLGYSPSEWVSNGLWPLRAWVDAKSSKRNEYICCSRLRMLFNTTVADKTNCEIASCVPTCTQLPKWLIQSSLKSEDDFSSFNGLQSEPLISENALLVLSPLVIFSLATGVGVSPHCPGC